jgi:hypothetical protein
VRRELFSKQWPARAAEFESIAREVDPDRPHRYPASEPDTVGPRRTPADSEQSIARTRAAGDHRGEINFYRAPRIFIIELDLTLRRIQTAST